MLAGCGGHACVEETAESLPDVGIHCQDRAFTGTVVPLYELGIEETLKTSGNVKGSGMRIVLGATCVVPGVVRLIAAGRGVILNVFVPASVWQAGWTPHNVSIGPPPRTATTAALSPFPPTTMVSRHSKLLV